MVLPKTNAIMQLRLRLAALLLTALLCACQGGSRHGDAPATRSDAIAGPLVIAHRGYSGIAPENTNVAVELGIASGADFIEIDVQQAADGGLVVMHDTTLTRTTNAPLLYPQRAPWNVGDFSLAEMRGLDAGTWYGYQKEIGNFDYMGERVPDLRTILDTLHGRAGLLLEVKSPGLYPGIEQAIAEGLEEAGWVVDGQAMQPLIVQSFHWDSMQRYAQIHPDVQIGLLGNPPQDDETWSRVGQFADSINPGHANVDRALVGDIHRRGFDISVYTVNDAERMRELMEIGVDGIITDLPSRLLRLRDSGTPPQGEFELANPQIGELSGLAPSTLAPGMFWAHNDSGDTPRIFAFDWQGRDLGSATIGPASAVDWEDMASYQTADGHFLLLADVGDNEAVRPFVQLHIVREPGEPPISGQLPVDTTITVLYPDGARDCEGVAVDAATGFVYLLSKRDSLPRLYRVPLDSPPLMPVTAEYLGEINSLPLPEGGELAPAGSITKVSPTALAFSSDGSQALIVTLEHSYLYRRDEQQDWLQALNGEPVLIEVPDYPQIEAGDFHRDGILIGSEGQPAAMFAN